MSQLPLDAVVLAVHGGAGAIARDIITPDLEAQFRAGISDALDAGYARLQQGGSSLDAIEAAISSLEDCPLFNAGRGAVFTHKGQIELDASCMNGQTLAAGAVTCVQGIQNPIQLARRVMENSNHVLLSGQGAEEFALEQGFPRLTPDYFFTQLRWDQLEESRRAGKMMLDAVDVPREHKFGTVGAVALDAGGNLAAGTSTGGMTNKRYGRVGDSPIVGAGVYANNRTCAVSSTGHGEFFIRGVVAYDISALMEYRGLTVQAAAEEVIRHKMPALGGSGGVIALDALGHLAMPFNTVGMYRGSVTRAGQKQVDIW